MIKPTIGRVVLYNDGLSDQRVPMLITYVHSGGRVNLGGFDQFGKPMQASSVRICSDGEDCRKFTAEWMPYQKGQAKKTEALESQLKQAKEVDRPVVTIGGGGVNFSHALTRMKEGFTVRRAGWNGKGMFIFLVEGSTFYVNRPPLLGIYAAGTEVSYHAHIDMKTADNMVVPWLCSQTDMLSDDWEVMG